MEVGSIQIDRQDRKSKRQMDRERDRKMRETGRERMTATVKETDRQNEAEI